MTNKQMNVLIGSAWLMLAVALPPGRTVDTLVAFAAGFFILVFLDDR